MRYRNVPFMHAVPYCSWASLPRSLLADNNISNHYFMSYPYQPAHTIAQLEAPKFDIPKHGTTLIG